MRLRTSWITAGVVSGALGAAVIATAEQEPTTPASLQDALAQAQRARATAAQRALASVASGDPVDGFLAVDAALELDPTNAELTAAKKTLEAHAVEAGVSRAARLRASGRLSQALELLGHLAIATDDARVQAALKEARADLEARRAEAGHEGEQGVDPGERVDKRELDRRMEDVSRRLEAMGREIDRLRGGQFKGGAAEPQIDVLQRRMDETRRDVERMIGDVRREIDSLSRDVQSLRRDVDRIRR